MAITTVARATKTGSGTVNFALGNKALPSEINVDCNAIIAKINELVAALNTIQTDLNTAEGSITTLQAEMVTAQSDITTNAAAIALNTTHRTNARTVEAMFRFEIPGDAGVAVDVAMPQYPTIALTIVGVYIKAETAPTGADLIADIHLNGTTIYTTQANRPTIPAGSTSRVTCTAPDVTSLGSGNAISIDFDQVGAAVVGADIQIELEVTQAVTES